VAERRWWPLAPGGERARPLGARSQAAAAKKTPIDPLTGPRLALAGDVVTMDASFRVKRNAVVYVDSGSIAAVQARAQKAPPGFDGVSVVETGGTLFPGLIELHNHLSYDALPLWSPVPRQFTHRGQWPDHKDYRRLISGPMTVLGKTPGLLPALVRYVECKCLVGGVTTSQGIKLNSNAGISRFYRGIVRNVEQTDEPDLPEAQARIDDIEAKDAKAFRDGLLKDKGKRCRLLHLSEGVTDASRPDASLARRHFLALEVKPREWAITDALAGIHAAGLLDEDFGVLASNGGSMVWSPLSNLLLYGATARVDAARREGVKIGIGSDWSPSGSKNLLGELKVAWLFDQLLLGGSFRARDLVAMATRTAARILKWEHVLGSLEPGKRADLLVIDGTSSDPYGALLHAKETALRLVMINGVARYGRPELMAKLAPGDQTLKVGGQTRRFFLRQATADPDVHAVALSTARDTLAEALADVQKLARDLEKPARAAARVRRPLDGPEPTVWTLALDEIRDDGLELRPRLPYAGPRDFAGPSHLAPRAAARAASPPLSELLGPIALDPLSVADDGNFLAQIEAQPNVPLAIRQALRQLY
jgi:hypothetical protein